MKKINEIYAEFLLGKIRFHRVVETDLYRDSLMFYMDEKYSTSATLCAVLYEMIFTTRLIRETSNPPGYKPSKENMDEQFHNLLNRENEVINIQKLSFRKITDELVKAVVITSDEKADYDKFYTDIRNPIAHGLTHRLFESMLKRAPGHAMEAEISSKAYYKPASEIIINKIYELMTVKVLRKQ